MNNINEQKRYIFKKDYIDKMGTIHEGSQIDWAHNQFFFNGGMCDSYSRGLFNYIVNSPKLKAEYLREIRIVSNPL